MVQLTNHYIISIHIQIRNVTQNIVIENVSLTLENKKALDDTEYIFELEINLPLLHQTWYGIYVVSANFKQCKQDTCRVLQGTCVQGTVFGSEYKFQWWILLSLNII